MKIQATFRGACVDAGKAAMVAALCCVMVTPQAFGEEPLGTPSVASTAQKTPLTRDQKTLHALNRMTFGPRPGDEQAVAKMGLEAWFERQLHPEAIDDSAFETRMEQFPALKLTQTQLMQKFPTPQMVKAMARRDAALPTDPVAHAIYADSEFFYERQQQGQAVAAVADKTAVAGDMNDMAAGNEMAAAKTADGQEMAAPAAGKAAAEKKRKSLKGTEEAAMSDEDVEAILALAPEQRFAKLVAMTPEEMVSFRKGMKPRMLPMLAQGLTPEQKEDVAAMQGGLRLIGAEALEERILRDVYSERQLQAVMDDFWLNHFSVYVRKSQDEPYYLAAYDRDAILPNAMGKFEDLLVATAKSPAMLRYLDNWESIGPDSPAAKRGERYAQMAPNSPIAKNRPKGINENYARELLELHTYGVSCEVTAEHPASKLSPSCGAGYTQADVINVAKCLTGWTIDRPYGGGGGGFVFEETRHEGGSKVVLGKTIPEGGMQEGLTVLHMLATSPATAHFVSAKIAERFVSDAPPAALVNRMAATFLKTDGDIKAVLTTMFHAPEFWAPTVYRAKVKTPIEFMASALRASNADVKNPLALVQAMDTLGMPIYGMQTPNGYSWQADHWVSSNALVSRMNFALVLSGGRVPGAKTDWLQVLGSGADSGLAAAPTPKTELELESIILGESAATRTRATVLQQFNNPTAQAQAAESFSQSAAKPADGQTMDDAAMVQRVKAGGRRGYGQQQGFQQNVPETPLDTMAGLLLGSPDFQRR